MDAQDFAAPRVPLLTIAREWTRVGCIGFGGPPNHIILLRRLCVERRRWLDEREFDDGVAAANLLPGPASTQLSIWCAWRLRGAIGALVGGVCFIVPGLVLILVLAAVFLDRHSPTWVLGSAAGAGAAVPAVALNAARTLIPASRRALGSRRFEHARWMSYVVAGGVAAALAGSYLVLALVACGVIEIVARGGRRGSLGSSRVMAPALVHVGALGGLGALAWVALKVGALSYGGGFVIVPLMQHDVVSTYHWMSGSQFLSVVALGQLTPGPVVQTVAAVGYAARGIAGGLLAALIVFTPSFVFVIAGAPHFDRVRTNSAVRSFLRGAGPAVIGAIAGSAIPLGRSLTQPWQIPILAGAILLLTFFPRRVVGCLILAGAIGLLLALSGVSV